MVPGLKSRTSWIFCLAGIIAVGILSRVVRNPTVGLRQVPKRRLVRGDGLRDSASVLEGCGTCAGGRVRHAPGAPAGERACDGAHLRASYGNGVQLPGSAHVRGGHLVDLSRGFFECVKGRED